MYTTQTLWNIRDLYLEGKSCSQIKDVLELRQSVRHIQRVVKSMNIIRSRGEAFRLAVSQGRVDYQRKKRQFNQRKTVNAKMRFEVFKRCDFRCVICGEDGSDNRLEVDHINENPSDNRLDNLQILCSLCNKGKSFYLRD